MPGCPEKLQGDKKQLVVEKAGLEDEVDKKNKQIERLKKNRAYMEEILGSYVRVTGRPQIIWSFFEGKMNTLWRRLSRDCYAGYKGIKGYQRPSHWSVSI